jgi:hypothetical protein
MLLLDLTVCGFLALGQASVAPSGAWDSELGRVTMQEAGGAITGAWEGPGGRRGQITEGRLQGSTLVFEYATSPDNARGRAVLVWNPRSQAWEGSWRNRDGRSGG